MDIVKVLQAANEKACAELIKQVHEVIKQHPDGRVLQMFLQDAKLVDSIESPGVKTTDVAVSAGQSKPLQLYDLSSDFGKSKLLNDGQIPGIKNFAQVINDAELRRLLIPYYNQPDEVLREEHINLLKKLMIEVLRRRGITVPEACIMQTANDGEVIILQVKDSQVSDKENREFVEEVIEELKKEKNNARIVINIKAGMETTRYSNSSSIYPLPSGTPAILNHIVKIIPGVTNSQPIIINNTYNINVQDNSSTFINSNHNTVNNKNSQTIMPGASLEDFILHLRKERPVWTDGRDYMTASELADKYEEFSGKPVSAVSLGMMLSRRYPECKKQRKIDISKLLSGSAK
jgi:hypothetical protein